MKSAPKSRFECKYRVSNRLAESVRQSIQAFVEPDPHAATQPAHEYRVASLYLDAPDLRLYRETLEGVQNRVKLRIRRYGPERQDPDQLVFLEIKQRYDRVVAKTRARVSAATAEALLAGDCPLAELETQVPPSQRAAFRSFVHQYGLNSAVPIVHVEYHRQAYVGRYHRDARVTFDRRIAAAAPEGARLGATRWQTASDALVLELKFDQRLPGWMQDVVTQFGLQRTSFSKYATSVDCDRNLVGFARGARS